MAMTGALMSAEAQAKSYLEVADKVSLVLPAKAPKIIKAGDLWTPVYSIPTGGMLSTLMYDTNCGKFAVITDAAQDSLSACSPSPLGYGMEAGSGIICSLEREALLSFPAAYDMWIEHVRERVNKYGFTRQARCSRPYRPHTFHVKRYGDKVTAMGTALNARLQEKVETAYWNADTPDYTYGEKPKYRSWTEAYNSLVPNGHRRNGYAVNIPKELDTTTEVYLDNAPRGSLAEFKNRIMKGLGL